MASGALSPPMTSTAARKQGSPVCGAGFQPAPSCGAGFQPALGWCREAGWKPAPQGSALVGVHLQRQLRVDVPAIVARAVGQLPGAALGAADVVDRLQRVVRAALALARLAGLLNGKHGESTPARTAATGVLAAAGAASSAGVAGKYE